MPLRSANRSRRGISLTETVIYLAVAGLILSGVWVTAASVTHRQSVNTANNDIIQIVQNMRALYQTTLHFSGAGAFTAGSDVTAQMVTATIFPRNMFNQGSVDPRTPWQNPVTLSVGAAGALNTFVVQLGTAADPIPEAACRELASLSSGTGRDPGLTNLRINAANYSGAALNALTPTTIANLANCTFLTYTFSF